MQNRSQSCRLNCPRHSGVIMSKNLKSGALVVVTLAAAALFLVKQQRRIKPRPRSLPGPACVDTHSVFV